jgi:taurine dioxygenase
MITITPLQVGLPFGVRINGMDLDTANDPAIRVQVNEAFEREGMIIFENVVPSNALQVALSTIFGPLKPHPAAGVPSADPDYPGVIEIRNRPHSGGCVSVGGKQLSHWLPWHFDHCYNDELNLAGVLRATEIVPEGGITGFSDGIALYNALPTDLRSRIEGTDILYILDVQYGDMRFGVLPEFKVIQPKPMAPEFEAQAKSMPRALHPAVWTRPSGEKVLHVSPWMAQGIAGDETVEGDALLEQVCQAINALAPQCSYHHRWKPTDMVIWDNRRMLHCVSGHDPAHERAMIRTTIRGDYGLGRFEGDAQGGKILSETMV